MQVCSKPYRLMHRKITHSSHSINAIGPAPHWGGRNSTYRLRWEGRAINHVTQQDGDDPKHCPARMNDLNLPTTRISESSD
jgi:hypothetical protein